jgi:hypothetical protein
VASLVAGQLAALLGLVLFGGVLMPMLLAVIGSAAGCLVVAEPRRASPTGRRLELPGPQQPAGRALAARQAFARDADLPHAPAPRLKQQPGALAADHVPRVAPYPVAALSVEAALQRAHAASHAQSLE